jgi:hypothetical protein
MRNRDDSPTIEERVGAALAMGNLRQREGPCQLDKIGVLGMVGISEKLADAVYRLKYSNEATSYNDAFDGVYRLARVLDRRNRWRMRGTRLRWMTRRVLDYWLIDNCFTCTGVGYQPIPGSPHLSDRPCPSCHGTRKRPMPWIKRLPRKPEGRRVNAHRLARWTQVCRKLTDQAERSRHLLAELEKTERWIGEKIIAKLSTQGR